MLSPMTYHPITTRIISLLTKHGAWFETFEHEAVRTSEEAAALRPEYTLHQGAKALIVSVKYSPEQKKLLMLVFPADMKFSEKKVKAALGIKSIRFATKEESDAVTSGVEFGGVPPFGNLFELEVICDPAVLANEKIIFNAGDRSFSVGMFSKEYVNIVAPRVVDIC